MARPRRYPPSTPFGLWLDHWFTENPGVTFEAFAQDVGVTKSVISLWIGARKRIAVKPATLREIAVRTGARLEDLELMVYGEAGKRERPVTAGDIVLSREELETLLQAAAERAVRLVLAEQEGRT